jgi:uncharacterized protein YkwD
MPFQTTSRMASTRVMAVAIAVALVLGFAAPGSAAQKKKKRARRPVAQVVAAAPVPAPAPAPASGADSSLSQRRSEAEAAMSVQLLERVNAERSVRGLSPLRWDPGLAALARNWSETMAASGNFTHRPKGSESAFAVPAVCCWENIYSVGGTMSSAQLHDGWMRSAGHRNNILSREVTAMGVGVVCGAGGASYATENFATETWKGLGTPATAADPRAPQTGVDVRCP